MRSVMYAPGELDEKLDFKRSVLTPDGIGGNTEVITDVALGVWCKVRPLSGKEVERFQQVTAEELTLFVTRWRTDILENDRIFWNAQEYNIKRIPKRSRRSMYTEYYAERGVAQ